MKLPTTPAEGVAALQGLVQRHQAAVKELLGKPEVADYRAWHERSIEELNGMIARIKEANGL